MVERVTLRTEFRFNSVVKSPSATMNLKKLRVRAIFSSSETFSNSVKTFSNSVHYGYFTV